MSWPSDLGDVFYPLVALFEVAVAVAILAVGRRDPLRVALASILVFNASFALRTGHIVDVIPGDWILLMDEAVLATLAWVLAMVPRPLGGTKWFPWFTASLVAFTLMVMAWSMALWHGAAGPVLLPAWTSAHDLMFLPPIAVLGVHTVPRLVAMRPGPLRTQGVLIAAGIGAGLFGVVIVQGVLMLMNPVRLDFALLGSRAFASWAWLPALLVGTAATVRASHGAIVQRRPELVLLAIVLAGAWLGFALPAMLDKGLTSPILPELFSFGLRPILFAVAALQFDLHRAPRWLARTLGPSIVVLFALTATILAASWVAGPGALERPDIPSGALLLSAALVGGTYLLTRGRVHHFIATAQDFGGPARLHRYRLALERAEASQDDADLGRLRRELRITPDEHATLMAVLADHVLVPTSAIQGARPGAVLGGRYEVVRELGEGGQGRALLARDTRQGQQVVLKESGRPWEKDAERAMRAMRREARAAGRVDHPCIAKVHGLVEEVWQIFLVREYVEGQTAFDRVEQEGPLPLEDAAAVVADVGRGLAALHEAQVLHLDIKPQNVVIRGDGRAVLIDQGSAVLAPGQEDAVDATRGLAAGGHDVSLRWAAPEQLDEDPNLTVATDVFQLAGLLAHLVNGRPPVPGEDAAKVQRRVRAGPAAIEWKDSVPEPVRVLVAEARSPAPEARVPSADAFVARLLALV